jgi:hypothetical protein
MLKFLFLIFLFWLGYTLFRILFGVLAFSRNLNKFSRQGSNRQTKSNFNHKKDEFYPDENVVDAEFKEV